MKRLLKFPLKPAEVCPECQCLTVQTNTDNSKYCSREKCSYRFYPGKPVVTPPFTRPAWINTHNP